MVFTYEDKIIIKHYREVHNWGYVKDTIHKHRSIDDFEQLKREIGKTWKAIPPETIAVLFGMHQLHYQHIYM